MRDLASDFSRLQEARHVADYEPQAMLTHDEVLFLTDTAAVAMEALDHTTADEQADILALMLVRVRN